MAAVGIGVAYLGNEGQLAVVLHLHQGPERRMQAQVRSVGSEIQHLLARDGDVGPQAVVQFVAVGHQGVELVVAAEQVDHYQNFVFGLGRQGGFGEQRGCALPRASVSNDFWINSRRFISTSVGVTAVVPPV